MASFLETVLEHFSTDNLYEALGVNKDCQEVELKRAYHRLSLQVHPDKVPPGEAAAATKKFQVIFWLIR